MKAAIGILLVFTGLTVGYLVLAGKLPMSVPASTPSIGLPNITPQSNTTASRKGNEGLPTPGEFSYTAHGGGLLASVPDTYVQGQIKAGRYAL